MADYYNSVNGTLQSITSCGADNLALVKNQLLTYQQSRQVNADFLLDCRKKTTGLTDFVMFVC